MYQGHKYKVSSAVVLAVLISSGCATTVSQKSKDTSGNYDGDWTARVLKASSPQTVHRWIFNCTDLSQSAPMTVSDGVVSMTLYEQKYTGFVDKGGKFKITLKAGRAGTSSQSERTLANSNVKVFISGNLAKSPAKGGIVVGFAEVGYNGCTSKIEYSRS